MARHLAAIVAALAFLAAAPAAQALRPIGDGPGIDDLPLEPPIDPCREFPGLCDPLPPTDPCELDPSLPECQPEPPVDPCDVSPIGCESEEPTADPGPTFPSHLSFAGSARVKGEGFNAVGDYAVTFNWDTATFLAVDGDGRSFTGYVVPKGPSDVKSRLYLDAASADAFADVVAGRAVEAANVVEPGPAERIAVLGFSQNLTFRSTGP